MKSLWIIFSGMQLAMFLICVNFKIVYGLIDPISLSVLGGVGWAGYTFWKQKIYCEYNECCSESYIPANIKRLEHSLDTNLFGQHIVRQHIIPALNAHFATESKSRKPLVMSFHGTPGTGKNFVADQIAMALYSKGLQSRFVRKYMGRADFPVESNAEIYKNRIQKEVREAIAECPKSLFIFDEVDKMPAGVFESLVSLVDYNSVLDGQDNTKAIFIFLSNAAGGHISNHLGKLLNNGKLREETRLADFERTLQTITYNVEGGLKKTSLIESHVIDHFLPFLPLERAHVLQCIEAEFHRWNKWPSKEVIESMFNDIITYDRQYGIFSISGCKTLEKKVAIAVRADLRN